MLIVWVQIRQLMDHSTRQNSSLFVVQLYLWLFDRMDIAKGMTFILLKFAVFPSVLVVAMECSLNLIREQSQWSSYHRLYQVAILRLDPLGDAGDDAKDPFITFLYLVVIVGATSMVVCAYLSAVEIAERYMRPTAFNHLFRSVIESRNYLHPC